MTERITNEQREPQGEWETAQRICNLPSVDEALRNLMDDNTDDNAVCVVRAVLRAAPPAQAEPRKPLTDAAIQALFTATHRGVNSTALAFSSFEAGIRWAEQQHGIGGEE